jgi:formylglycine-generating enzyme required for sulfatase activity
MSGSPSANPALVLLQEMLASGDIDKATFERRSALHLARNAGAGAVAQGAGAQAVGQQGVGFGGPNSGTVNTGTLIVRNYIATGGAQLNSDQIAERVTGYLRWLLERTQHIELRGIEQTGGARVVRLPLETAYVPLRARPAARMGEDADAGASAVKGQAVRRSTGGKAPYELDVEIEGVGLQASGKAGVGETDIALNQVLGLGNRLAITGGAGCGKSTVLQHMAWALASSLLSGQAEPARSRLGLTLAPNELPLPLMVPLASYARHLRGLPANAPAPEKTLAYFITHHLTAAQGSFDLPADFFPQLLQSGQHVLLLLDGLDEVANEDERNLVRLAVEQLASGRPALRVLVTCRTVAYQRGLTALGMGFREVGVLPLDFKTHITPMVRQAYACIHVHDKALRETRASDLLTGITKLEAGRRARLGSNSKPLVDSPLMVRLLLIVHFNERELPNERARLFDKAILALLQVDYGRDDHVINELKTGWERFLDMAQHLAMHMHSQGGGKREAKERGRDEGPGREIDEASLKGALRSESLFTLHIQAFLSQVRQRGSVIEERNGSFQFIHLAFQEFLVARYLHEVAGEAGGQAAILARLDAHLADPWWREPVLLLAGYKAAKNAAAAGKFVDSLAGAGTTPNARWCAAELAATAALEWRDSSAPTRALCTTRIVELLADEKALLDSEPAHRARAGDALASLGDPRFDAKLLYLPVDANLGFVRIPADPRFCIGTRSADRERIAKAIGAKVYDDEINDKPTPTAEFYMARYPVTVAQFRAYVQATGKQPGEPNALRDPDSRPVRRVSWREAMDYCAWLQGMLSDGPAFADPALARLVGERRLQLTLPSELEWEKAARGGALGQAYSWGDQPDRQRANWARSGVGTTSVVGCFVSNGYGLHDMLGNVWEWTDNVFADDSYSTGGKQLGLRDAADEARLVVRGGSFFGSADLARCACRGRSHPGNRGDDLGFRVVLRSSPVELL